MFAWQRSSVGAASRQSRYTWALTDAGGPAGPPGTGLPPTAVGGDAYGEFNLGGHVGDDPARVAAHRGRLAAEIGVPGDRLLFMAQCHGADVVVVDRPWSDESPPVDALVTAAPGLALGVLVADCVPVLLADEDAGIIAVAHAGRPGLIGGIIGATLDAMVGLGARTRSIRAVVGPSVCGRCYEVPAAMRADAAAVSAVSATVSWTGTPAIDVAAGVVDQLRSRGTQLGWVPGCTREIPRLYSHRRHPRSGRFAGILLRTQGDGAR